MLFYKFFFFFFGIELVLTLYKLMVVLLSTVVGKRSIMTFLLHVVNFTRILG